MKICIVSYTLAMGGFSSSLLPMLKYLSEDGVQVDLLLFEKSQIEIPQYPGLTVRYHDGKGDRLRGWLCYFAQMAIMLLSMAINVFVKRRAAQGKSNDKNSLRLIRLSQLSSFVLVRRFFKEDMSKYDCVVAWEEVFPCYYVAKMTTAKRKVGYVHTDYERARFNTKIDKNGYAELDALVAVADTTRDTMAQKLPFFADKITSVRNVLDVEKTLLLADADAETFEKSAFDIVSVGRIDNKSKAFDRAVRVASRLKDDGFTFKWYIVGDGESREETQTLIEQLDMEDTFILLGSRNNPHPFTKKADLFVQPSRYEGKPMSVDEAIIIGTPVLVSEYKSAHEQVTEGKNGYIAKNDEEAIYEKLKYILLHEQELKDMKADMQSHDLSIYKDISSFLKVVKGDI